MPLMRARSPARASAHSFAHSFAEIPPDGEHEEQQHARPSTVMPVEPSPMNFANTMPRKNTTAIDASTSAVRTFARRTRASGAPGVACGRDVGGHGIPAPPT